MKIYRILPEKQARNLASVVANMQWQQGKARTKELTGTAKQNEEILHDKSLDEIGKRIIHHPEVQLDCLPLKLHAPKYSRYRDGNRYHKHTDAPWMGSTRTDLSCTLWLNDDYEGGELEMGGRQYKGKPGEALVYECGEPHEVLPVTSGERICVITWIQSRVRDPAKRRLVSDMRRSLTKLEGDDLFVEFGRYHSALLRMWAEV